MKSLTRAQRFYLGAIAAMALWVGVWCYFIPSMADIAIPWLVQPLCAGFLGAMYLSGGVFTASAMRARRWSDMKVILPGIVLWTGGLTVVSLFHLAKFNFARPQVWIWFGAYIVYPLVALWLMGSQRAAYREHPMGEAAIPRWAKVYLAAQGTGMIALAIALLAATNTLQGLWPWRTGLLMLQLYSMPLLAYGVMSFVLLRQKTWSEIRLALIAIGVFTGAGLATSVWHHALLDGPALAVGLWLGWLAIMTAALVCLARLASKAQNGAFTRSVERPRAARLDSAFSAGPALEKG